MKLVNNYKLTDFFFFNDIKRVNNWIRSNPGPPRGNVNRIANPIPTDNITIVNFFFKFNSEIVSKIILKN